MLNMGQRRTRMLLFVAFLIAAAIIGALMLQKYRGREQLPTTPVQPESIGSVRVSLFFASPDGNGLVREGREIENCGNDVSACIRETLAQLANGPLGDLTPTIPPAATVRDLQVRDDTAYLDFGRELADGLPGGSSAETTAVYSIVNTISFNFPEIKRVKFLLEGHDIDSLKGHIDLRMPIEPDFAMEKPTEVEPTPNSNDAEDKPL